MKKIQDTITQISVNWDALARFFIGVLFVYAGVEKIINLPQISNWIANVLDMDLSFAGKLILLSILTEILLGANLIWGKHKKDLTIKLLITYIIIVTVFVEYRASVRFEVISMLGINMLILKNTAIIGGLISLMDCASRKRSEKQ